MICSRFDAVCLLRCPHCRNFSSCGLCTVKAGTFLLAWAWARLWKFGCQHDAHASLIHRIFISFWLFYILETLLMTSANLFCCMCMHECAYAWMCVWAGVCASTIVHMWVCVYASVWVYMCVGTYSWVCVGVCLCVHMRVYISFFAVQCCWDRLWPE